MQQIFMKFGIGSLNRNLGEFIFGSYWSSVTPLVPEAIIELHQRSDVSLKLHDKIVHNVYNVKSRTIIFI